MNKRIGLAVILALLTPYFPSWLFKIAWFIITIIGISVAYETFFKNEKDKSDDDKDDDWFHLNLQQIQHGSCNIKCFTTAVFAFSPLSEIIGGATVFRGGFYSIGICRQLPWGKSRSLFWFLCFRRCFPRKRHSSARLHCRQPFWAWAKYFEDKKTLSAKKQFFWAFNLLFLIFNVN